MKNTLSNDLKIFLAVILIFLTFFVTTLVEIFAIEEYKPSRLFVRASNTNPVVEDLDEAEEKNYRVEPVDARIYFTTKSLMQGTCKATVPLQKTIYPKLNPIRDRLQALFIGPNEFEKSIGYTTSFEGWEQVFMGTVLQSDGTLQVRLNEEVLDEDSSFYLGKFDSQCGRGVWEQIYLTAKEDDRVRHIVFTINEDPSLWNKLVKKYKCPPDRNKVQDVDTFVQTQKQCAKPEES